MSFSRLDENEKPIDVRVDDERIRVRFEGDLELSVPTSNDPRLKRANELQRSEWELVGRGYGIHWPEIDEDLSIRALFQTHRKLPESASEQIPALVSDLMKTTGRLNALFSGRPFTPDGHLVGSIGEVVAEYIYGLQLELCSTPQVDARTSDGRTVQVKLTGASGQSYAFRYPVRKDEKQPDVLLGLKLEPQGFIEVYNGRYPTELLDDKAQQRNGQVKLSFAALQTAAAGEPLLRVRSFDDINRWFTPELADVA